MDLLTRAEIERVLGPVDDAFAAELITTGASEQELLEAHMWVTSDDAMVTRSVPAPTGKVAALIEILSTREGPEVTD